MNSKCKVRRSSSKATGDAATSSKFNNTPYNRNQRPIRTSSLADSPNFESVFQSANSRGTKRKEPSSHHPEKIGVKSTRRDEEHSFEVDAEGATLNDIQHVSVAHQDGDVTEADNDVNDGEQDGMGIGTADQPTLTGRDIPGHELEKFAERLIEKLSKRWSC